MLNPAIALDSVSFGYGENLVLNDVSISAMRGTFTAIIGPNGCGKSTALKLMAGLLPPHQGQVLIDGECLQNLPRRRIAQRLALLAQSGDTPASMRVADLVSMGRYSWESWLRRKTPKDLEHINNAMNKMEVRDLASKQVGELSGGQLQRARMAMTLAQDTSILLLDEPTNHLDLKHQHGLLKIAYEESRRGTAVVAVLHDLFQASFYADTLVLLHQGKVVKNGSPQTVLTPDTIEHVYGIRTQSINAGKAVIPIPIPEGVLS
ncbi:ABC transporter ATP-binding protein [Vibrio mimicus]